MKKIIVNQNTLNLAQKEMWLAFKECYLSFLHCFLTFLKEAKDDEEKIQIKDKIREVGEIYKNTISCNSESR